MTAGVASSLGDRRDARPVTAAGYRHFGAFRLLLATLVVLQHYLANLAPEALATWSTGNEMGSVAVYVFFCLSGFVIVEAADRFYRGRPMAFLGNRLLRIIPHFVIAVLLSAIIFYVFTATGSLRYARGDVPATTDAFTVTNVILNLFGFLPGADRRIAFNFLDIGWAVRVEMVFYVVVALCIVATKAVRVPLGVALAVAALGVAALGALASRGLPSMLQFAPYFVYGGSLYYVQARASRPAMLIAVAAAAAMMAHFLALPDHHPTLGFARDVTTEIVELVALIAAFSLLAFARFDGGRQPDLALGDLTYPLYLYHQGIMVAVLSLTQGYSYPAFVGAIAGSILLARAALQVVDPTIDRLRDRMRGENLRNMRA